jgi:flagellar protein FlaG
LIKWSGDFFCQGLAENGRVKNPGHLTTFKWSGGQANPFTWRYIMSVASVGYPVSQISIPIDNRGTVRQSQTVTQSETRARPQITNSTAEDLQRMSQVFNRKLQFVVDHNSNQVIVKVIDKETDKVIKEIPPEELQRLYRNLKEAIGLLFNEMV